MAGPLVYEKNVAVSFVPTIASIAAPTAAEVTAGTALQSYIPKDGIQFPSGRNMIDTGSIDSDFDAQYPGSTGGPLVVTFKRQNRDGDEAAWTLFKDNDPVVEGYIVIGFEGSNDTAADEVDVYQVAAHKPLRSNPGANTEQRFVINFGVQDEALGVAVTA